jgi:GNAT superfamily N-acetyltransferase
MDDVKSWFAQPNTGTAETGAAPFWRLARRYAPDIRTVVIRRPVRDVVASLARFGFDPAVMTRLMTRLDHKLDQIEARVPGALSVAFNDLASEQTCARVFEHCLPYKHDPAWYAIMAPLNIQIDMAALVRYMRAYQAAHANLADIARRQIIAGMGPRKTVQRDDVTIQQESCEAWRRDGERLFEEHAIQLGEPADGYLRRNWTVMSMMDRIGAMQIVTARCNGRMVGYYVCYIGPATDDASLTTALHISIFVSKDFSGLGTRLQRASLEALRAKGVGEICFRAGVLADGARMGAIYKRAGAEHIGQMYRLPLKET